MIYLYFPWFINQLSYLGGTTLHDIPIYPMISHITSPINPHHTRDLGPPQKKGAIELGPGALGGCLNQVESAMLNPMMGTLNMGYLHRWILIIIIHH